MPDCQDCDPRSLDLAQSFDRDASAGLLGRLLVPKSSYNRRSSQTLFDVDLANRGRLLAFAPVAQVKLIGCIIACLHQPQTGLSVLKQVRHQWIYRFLLELRAAGP